MTWLLVAVAGAAGAAARYLVDHAVTARASSLFPWGSLVVNVSGSFLAGLVGGLIARHGLSPELHTVVAGGFLGAYTTFSTAMYETVRLFEEQARVAGLGNLVLPLVASVAAAALGWVLAS